MLKIISGGQAGVDRAALDAAIGRQLDHGGWCPRGRLAEDGRIDEHYRLLETDTANYSVRTRKNVETADGTLIIYKRILTGGSRLTETIARQSGKPCLLIDLTDEIHIEKICQWLKDSGIKTLNIAGPRASNEPDIYDSARQLIEALLDAYCKK